ncbi:MAG: ferrous iron transport protein A [Bacteroidetes bacterium]|nr:ferrous iron transport protein A [Bacteroidota bacterium]MBL0054006.1 ferrous iron transport protein A [Bacteroidota bacterium]
MKLSQMHKGESGIIDSFTNDEMKLKLMEMGCLPGEKISISSHAPFGCPVAIKLSGYTLSLRMEEAENVIVTRTK